MDERGFSEKTAALFKVVGFLLLLPAAFGLLFSLFIISENVWICFAIWAGAGYGSFLLSRYFKHSRGELEANKVSAMWIGTIIFNSIFLVPLLLAGWNHLSPERSNFENPLSSNEIVFILAAVTFYATAVALSTAALIISRTQKYL